MGRTEPVLNYTEDLKKQLVLDSMCWDGQGEPRIGILALETTEGVYQFMVTELAANELIQQLRDFIAENAERLP